MTGATPTGVRPRPAAAPAIEIRGLCMAYGTAPVLDDLDLDVPTGAVTAILGASGSGKTTLLRVIAGFETADTGRIRLHGRVVDGADRTVGPRHRGIGYVPQDAALFPHLSVAANIGFGVPRAQRRARVHELLDLVGLPGYQHRYPHQLSGGQQQRVALARALAIRPTVVLLDEPFAALDAALREGVRTEALAILAQAGTTTILVTHDQDEALSSAGFVALLDAGRIAAHGTPAQLYQNPPTPAVALAIGSANILRGRIGDLERVSSPVGTLHATSADTRPLRPGDCQILLRPEQLQLTPSPAPGATRATVTGIRYHGHDTLVDLAVATDGPDGGLRPRLTARVTGPTDLSPGRPAWVTVTGAVRAWPIASDSTPT
jgi:iron(III) transport system ATP-binding protein